MNQKFIIWVLIVLLFSALIAGCTTGPQTQSSSEKNQENTEKKSEGSDYYD